MPLFLVACKSKADPLASESMVKRLVRFIKGPIDHVELSFVEEGRETYGLFITMHSKTVRFCSRDYSTIDKFYDVEWYELSNVDVLACEKYCADRQGRGIFSIWPMMRSAMPFDNETVIRAMSDFVETRAVPRAAFDRREVEEETQEFCASLTIKALQAGSELLKDVDPYKCTASDVVRLVLARFGGQLKPRPVFTKPAHAESEFVRSEDWYA